MSNLKLPNLGFRALHDQRTGGVVAYQTAVAQSVTSTGEPVVTITHHATVIATLRAASVSLNTGGYDSTTTANRLNHIVRDNGLPFFVGIKGGQTVIKHQDDKRTIVTSFRRASFDLIDGAWVLTDVDGVRNPYVQGVDLNSAPKPCTHPERFRFACSDGDEQCLECGAIRTPIDSANTLQRHAHPFPVWRRPALATSGSVAR